MAGKKKAPSSGSDPKPRQAKANDLSEARREGADKYHKKS